MIERAESVRTAAVTHSGARPAAAWTGAVMGAIAIVIAIIAFLVGPNWTLLWAALVLLVLAVTTDSVIRRLGHGQA